MIIFNVNMYTYIIINNSIDFIEIIKNQVERTEVQDPIYIYTYYNILTTLRVYVVHQNKI